MVLISLEGRTNLPFKRGGRGEGNPPFVQLFSSKSNRLCKSKGLYYYPLGRRELSKRDQYLSFKTKVARLTQLVECASCKCNVKSSSPLPGYYYYYQQEFAIIVSIDAIAIKRLLIFAKLGQEPSLFPFYQLCVPVLNLWRGQGLRGREKLKG